MVKINCFLTENECKPHQTFQIIFKDIRNKMSIEKPHVEKICFESRLITVCQKGVKYKKNCLGMTPIYFESLYPQASKKGRKKIFGVQNFDFSTF